MILCEAKEIIGKRSFPSDYAEMDEIVKNADADIMALRCIEAQMRLADLINDFKSMASENDTFSYGVVMDFLNEVRQDARFDEDGQLLPFKEDEDE